MRIEVLKKRWPAFLIMPICIWSSIFLFFSFYKNLKEYKQSVKLLQLNPNEVKATYIYNSYRYKSTRTKYFFKAENGKTYYTEIGLLFNKSPKIGENVTIIINDPIQRCLLKGREKELIDAFTWTLYFWLGFPIMCFFAACVTLLSLLYELFFTYR